MATCKLFRSLATKQEDLTLKVRATIKQAVYIFGTLFSQMHFYVDSDIFYMKKELGPVVYHLFCKRFVLYHVNGHTRPLHRYKDTRALFNKSEPP